MSTEAYKRTHRPKALTEDAEATGKPHQSIYIPTHPEKVIGGEIQARSGWESAFAKWCDDNPAVIEWGGETVAIQYRNPAGVDIDACKKYGADITNPMNWPVQNYYPDFYIQLRADDDEDGTKTTKMLIEIKPKHQTERPIPPPPGAKLQEQKRFNEAAKTYLQNEAKWKAAMAWCEAHGMKFAVFTEVTLQKMGIL